MKNICTVSDNNYLIKGLTLYESLKESSKDFILHYLCIDDTSFNKLIQFESETLKVWNINKLLIFLLVISVVFFKFFNEKK